MTVPHFIHVYNKPAVGSGFIARKQAFGYQHTIASMGWFDTANCQLAVTQKEGERAYESWVGNRVAVYVRNAAQPIWEGLISRITFEAGGVTFTRSLEEMFNRVKVTWKDTQTPATNQSTATNNTDSQAIYGIKEGSIDGLSEQGTSTQRADSITDLLVALQAFPLSSMSEGGGANILRLEMLGFYHTLEWENLRSTSNTARNPHTYFNTTLLPGLANGTTFFDNTDFSQIDTNTAWSSPERSSMGETVWQQVQKFTEPGDGVDRWIAGITPTGVNTGERLFYYRESNTTIEYTARVRDGMRIRNLYGGIVPPYLVRPDRGLRLTDVLVGWNSQGLDPRELYVSVVRYDGERQVATVQGADDISIDGAFRLRQLYKPYGVRFGAVPRTSN